MAAGLGARGALGGAALEALDATARVDQLLAAGVERVAVRADLDVDLRLRRARRELVAARAAHVSLDVLGMDCGLHSWIQCSGHLRWPELQRTGVAADISGMG